MALHARLTETLADKSFCNVTTMTQALAKRRVDGAAVTDIKKNFDSFEHAYAKVYAQYQVAIDEARAVGDQEKEARSLARRSRSKKITRPWKTATKKTMAALTTCLLKRPTLAAT